MRYYLSLLGCLLAVAVLLSAGCQRDVNNGESVLSAKKILKQIQHGKPITVSNKTISGVLDFTKVCGSNKKLDVSAVYIPVEISFRNCVFEDSVVAFCTDPDTRRDVFSVFERNVNFLDCDFKSALVMRQVDFRGRFDFDLSKVAGESDFSGSHFGRGVSFCKANFNDDTYFVSCNFDGRANFFKVFFRNAAVLQYVRFNDVAMFTDSYFYGGVDMSKIFASSSIDFANTKFSGNVIMSNSQYLGDLRLVACQFSKSLSMLNNKIYGTLNLSKSQMGVQLNVADNVLYMEPELGDYLVPDSCTVVQNGNRILTTVVKQIF